METTCTKAIAEWARGKPLINRVWFFGSRVRGDHFPNSDLDIAVEIDSSSIQGSDASGGYATWCFESKAWQCELGLILSLKLDLQYYREGETPTIQAGLDQSSVLVYEKGRFQHEIA